MKKINNKGFSLVELVVATAILAIIGVTITMLMTSGTNMFSGVQKISSVLFKSEVSSIQLENTLVNIGSDDGFAIKDDKTLFIADKSENKLTELYIRDNTLRMKEFAVTVSEGKATYNAEAPLSDIPFGSNIKDVNYSVKYDTFSGINYAKAMSFSITSSKASVKYDKNVLINMKNKPVYVGGSTADNTLINIIFKPTGGE